MSNLFPILLAGGTGKRLWPLSRKSYPKQFSKLLGKSTLFQSSAQRLTSSEIVKFLPHITLTNSDFRFIVAEQLQEIGINPGPILIEPETKNTAAAILAASIFVLNNEEDAILLTAPSDHVIPDIPYFHNAINIGLSHVVNGRIVSFGVSPIRPETGYGYLELSTNILDPDGTSNVLSFVEKPNENRAKQMLATGNFLWNTGIFLFHVADMINAFKMHAPKTFELVSEAVENASKDLGFLRLDKEPWAKLDDLSIDHAIMEKSKNLVAVPYSSKWSDLGGWDAIWLESKSDSNGNVLSESAHSIKCTDSLLRSESKNQQVVGIGLDKIIAIAMNDAVLVAHKDKAQDVNKVVELLIKKEINQAEIFPKDHRPWGWFDSLALCDSFQVKRIYVKPGASLSLQSHKYRSEHWIVVEGTAKVTIDEVVKVLTKGQSVDIPVGAKHRLENFGQLPMILIEVQIGSYLEEDDIIRYEDVYSRS